MFFTLRYIYANNVITESKVGLLQYSDARQQKGLLMAPLSPRDVTSCHVELFTFSRQCSQHCLFISMIFAALSEVSDISTASVTSEVVPPKFTQLLKDLDCVEGQKIRFECRVIGHPTPLVKWFRENQEIISSTDFQVRIIYLNGWPILPQFW